MKLEQFSKAAEALIESEGLPAVLGALAEICRNRGNVEREPGGDLRAARLWTHCGAVLFNAEAESQRNNPQA